MEKSKILIGVAIFAVAAYFAVKLAKPSVKPTAAPTPATQPGPAPAAAPQGGEAVQDTMGLAGLSKGSLGTVKVSENLSIPDAKLRGICAMYKKMDPTGSFPADKNPFITEKPDLVDFAALAGFGTIPLIDVSQAGAVLFSDDADHRTGVWLLQFKNEQSATSAMPMLRTGPVLRKGGLLMTFWHDAAISDACELAVRAYYVDKGFESTLGGPR